MTVRERFIITGGSGFVGSNLVAALLGSRPGAEIVIIDDFSSSHFSNVVSACDRANVAPFHGECIGRCYTSVDWNDLLSKPTRAVFHLAAITDTTVMDQQRMLAINTEGFRPLVDACLKHGVTLAYCSSAATYGTPPQTAARVAFPISAAGRPNNIYGFSKWLMESVASRAIARAGGSARSSVVGLRYFNVYGDREQHKGRMASVAYHFFNQFRAEGHVRLFEGSGGYGDGEQRRDFVSVEDVVRVNLHFLRNPDCSGIFNCGSGKAQAFNDVAVAVINTLRGNEGRPALSLPELQQQQLIRYIPFPGDLRGKYQSYTQADLSALRAAGYGEPFLTVEQGVSRYVAQLLARAAV